MMKNLPFVSIILIYCLTLTGCISSKGTEYAINPSTTITTDSTLTQYRVSIQFREHNMSGIMLIQYKNNWNGKFMNEFGISIFDFTASEQYCSIKHAISALDKWYIRHTIEKDLLYLLSPKQRSSIKNRKVDILTDGTIALINVKHNIQYHFYKLKNETAE